MSDLKQVRVAICGAGLSGLALANALLNDPEQRYQVDIFERDTLSYDSERGGYQVRLGEQGISGLRGCLDPELYKELAQVWGHGTLRISLSRFEAYFYQSWKEALVCAMAGSIGHTSS